MRPELFFEVLAPLMGVDGTVVLGISTASGKNHSNYFTDLGRIKMEDPGTGEMVPVFKFMKFGLACGACEAAGKSQTCQHRSHYQPRWKTDQRQNMLRAIYGEGRRDLFSRENQGSTVGDEVPCFTSASIEALAEAPPTLVVHPRQVVFVAVDPHGGGPGSEFAVVSFFYQGAGICITGITTSKPGLIRSAWHCYATHMRGLRARPEYRKALFVVIMESDMDPLITSYFEKATQEQLHTFNTPYVFMSKDPKNRGRIGVWTSQHKPFMIKRLKDRLDCHSVSYAQPHLDVTLMDSLNDEHEPGHAESAWKGVCRQLEAQLRSFIMSTNERTGKIQYSGKAAGPDDVAMALMIGLFWSGVAIEENRLFGGFMPQQ